MNSTAAKKGKETNMQIVFEKDTEGFEGLELQGNRHIKLIDSRCGDGNRLATILWCRINSNTDWNLDVTKKTDVDDYIRFVTEIVANLYGIDPRGPAEFEGRYFPSCAEQTRETLWRNIVSNFKRKGLNIPSYYNVEEELDPLLLILKTNFIQGNPDTGLDSEGQPIILVDYRYVYNDDKKAFELVGTEHFYNDLIRASKRGPK